MGTQHFTLVLDTAPPANPTMSINAGDDLTGDEVVEVEITSPDVSGGAADVTAMKIWGDVDASADPTVGAIEGLSAWIPYQPSYNVALDPGSDGLRQLFAKLRDDVGNETLTFSSRIVLDRITPVVSIISAADRTRISEVSGFDRVSFTWSVNQDIVAYEVRVVSVPRASHQSGVPIGNLYGSSNTSFTGAIPTGSPIDTVVTGADLALVSPGDTAKVLKVFAQSAGGTWST